MRTKSFLTIGLILLFGSLVSGCDAVASKLQDVLASATPTPTITPVFTSSPTATPLPALNIMPCPSRVPCINSVGIADLVGGEVKPGVEYIVSVPFDTSVSISAGWIAQNEFTLQENLENMTAFIEVDGSPVNIPNLLRSEPYVDKDGNEYASAWVGAVFSGWQAGQPRRVRIGFRVNGTITDGWNIYQAGDKVEYLYLIQPVLAASPSPEGSPNPLVTLAPPPTLAPTLIPTRTPTSTRTPAPTRTPTSTRKANLPTGSPTPTVACTVDSTIAINNLTGGTITFYLTGPAKFLFYIGIGSQTMNVCQGSYDYTAYGCGGVKIIGTMSSGEAHEFRCD